MSGQLDVSALELWLWGAACVTRGPVEAPKFKDYILPLVFHKRLSDMFNNENQHLAHDFGGRQMSATLLDQDRQLKWFSMPKKARRSNYTTLSPAKINWTIPGIKDPYTHRRSFHKECYPDLKPTYVLANSIFNDRDLREELLR